MTITLTEQESEEYFYNSLCNGISYMEGYGLEMKTKEAQYKAAKETLQQLNPGHMVCYEDVLMQILRAGGTLTLDDIDNDGEETATISLADVHEKVCKTPATYLMQMVSEQDDATTADCILQTVFYDDIIFG